MSHYFVVWNKCQNSIITFNKKKVIVLAKKCQNSIITFNKKKVIVLAKKGK